MKIIDFYASDNKDHWLSEINKCDWRAGKYLCELLRNQELKELCGEWATISPIIFSSWSVKQNQAGLLGEL